MLSTPLSSLLSKHTDIKTLCPETKLFDALKFLKDHQLNNVVVFSESEGYLGFVSAFDIVYSTNFSLGEALSEKTLRSVLPFSIETSSGHWQGWGAQETVGSVLVNFSNGIHRMLVSVNDDARILTQSDIVHHFYEADHQNPIFHQTLEHAGLGLQKEVASVEESTSTLDAFRLIHEKRVTALAILKNNQVVGTLSTSDIRDLTRDSLDTLEKPVRDFSHSKHPICVKKTDTVGKAVSKLLEGKIHRVWVVDDHGHLEGVVTLTDILSKWV